MLLNRLSERFIQGYFDGAAFPESADAFEQAIRAGFDGGDFAAMMDSAQQIAEGEFQEVLN